MAREKVLIDFRGVIDDWGEYWKDENGVWHASSLEGVRQAVESSPKGADVVLNIDSNGGSVAEGLKIYDYLTTYDYAGGQLYTNIVGGCHSMAVVVLLTAPFENRSANANIRALIHEVRTWGNDITIEEAEKLAKQLQVEQDAILDIYAARTTTKRAELEEIMKEETEHTAQELQKWGFIKSINSLSVNAYFRERKCLISKNSNMAKSTESYNKFVKGLRAFLNKTNNCNVCDYDYKDADGVIVFSTEGEEDNLAVGVSVVLTNGETGGTYTLNDGRTVTIVDNIVTEIAETANEKNEGEGDPAPADPAPADPAPAPEPPAPTANEARLQEMETLLQTAQETINAQLAEIKELQTEVARLTASNHRPAGKPANAMPKTDTTPSERSMEEIKNEANERRIKAFKKTFN